MTTSRVSGLIPLLCITLFCVGMVEGGYRLFEHFLLDPRPASGLGPAARQAEQAGAKRLARTSPGAEVILRRNLFGAMAGDRPAGASLPERTEPPVATTLQLVLMGTVIGSEGDERAIILDKTNKKQDLYSKGEEIQGALVKEIRRGKVILALNGRDEILDISEAAKERPRVVPPPPVAAVKNMALPEAATPPPEAEAGFLGEGSEPQATQISLSRVSHVARGKQPGKGNPRSNATQHQGNTNE